MRSRPGIVVAAAVLVLGGCGADRPTAEEAGTTLTADMAEVKEQFLDLNEDVVDPWRSGAAENGSTAGTYTGGCEDGNERRASMATVSVARSGDEDTWDPLGLLTTLGWDDIVYDAQVDPDGRSIPRQLSLERSADPAGAVVDVVYQQTGTVQRRIRGKSYDVPVVHYVFTARTACLPTG